MINFFAAISIAKIVNLIPVVDNMYPRLPNKKDIFFFNTPPFISTSRSTTMGISFVTIID